MSDVITNNELFYKNKKVLVTGHTGFKGAWLVCILKYFGADAVGFALNPEEGSLYEQIDGNTVIKSMVGNICDYELLKQAVCDIKPEIIIHLAAYGFVNECYNNPRRAYTDNIIGTVNLLETIRECESVKSAVFVSTDKVYENKGDGVSYIEGDPLGGESPYSCSKTCMDLIVKDYYKTYFLPSERRIGISTVRASNVLAGGDHIESRLIPSILHALDNGLPVELRNPNQTRPWQSVLDALDGYLCIAKNAYLNPEEYSGPWNIGPYLSGIKSVGWVFEKIRGYFHGMASISSGGFEVKESDTLGLDIGKALEMLDWKPRLSTEEIIEGVVSFYKGKKAGTKPIELCMEQIRAYYSRCL